MTDLNRKKRLPLPGLTVLPKNNETESRKNFFSDFRNTQTHWTITPEKLPREQNFDRTIIIDLVPITSKKHRGEKKMRTFTLFTIGSFLISLIIGLIYFLNEMNIRNQFISNKLNSFSSKIEVSKLTTRVETLENKIDNKNNNFQKPANSHILSDKKNEITFKYKVHSKDSPIEIMWACGEKDPKRAIDWLAAHNSIDNWNKKLPSGFILIVPCEIRTDRHNEVWQARKEMTLQHQTNY